MNPAQKTKECCLECKKPLQATTCPACAGRSYHRQHLISKRPCSRCNGTGKEYHCADELEAIKQLKVDEWIRSYGQSVI